MWTKIFWIILFYIPCSLWPGEMDSFHKLGQEDDIIWTNIKLHVVRPIENYIVPIAMVHYSYPKIFLTSSHRYMPYISIFYCSKPSRCMISAVKLRRMYGKIITQELSLNWKDGRQITEVLMQVGSNFHCGGMILSAGTEPESKKFLTFYWTRHRKNATRKV